MSSYSVINLANTPGKEEILARALQSAERIAGE
jgi:hypothetical protein